MQVNKLLRYGALAVFVGAGVGAAHADEATTTGGIKIKSSDGNFDASIGGRVHFDGEVIVPDHGSSFGTGSSNSSCVDTKTNKVLFGGACPGGLPVDGSGNPTIGGDPVATAKLRNGGEKSSFYFRRVFLSLSGHLYGWQYLIDEDLAATGTNGLNDAWVAHSVFGGDTFYFGQHKPWRSMEEIASNNITPFMERSIVSDSGGGSTGVYGGRDYEDGVFYKWGKDFGHSNLWAGASVYTLGKASNLAAGAPSVTVTTTNVNQTTGTTVVTTTTTPAQAEGTGYNVRLAFAPLIGDGYWLHIGAAGSIDNADYSGGFTALSSGYQFVGRQGATATLASYATSPLGNNPNVTTIAGEVAGAFGPAYVEAEFANARYRQTGVTTNTVQAGTVIAAYAITGETRPYNKDLGTYGAIKPSHAFGALEVLARFDAGRNDGGGVGKFIGSNVPSGATTDRLYSATAGVNYYINPAVRFMLNYMHGSFDSGVKGKDNANSFEGRISLLF
jgi:phosphate-selective porin OprO/OprP